LSLDTWKLPVHVLPDVSVLKDEASIAWSNVTVSGAGNARFVLPFAGETETTLGVAAALDGEIQKLPQLLQ
jgi:hypothetical protein